MEPEEGQGRSRSISPARSRLPVRHFSDLALARQAGLGSVVLQVDPEDPNLFRSTEFLDALVEVAKDRALPVIMVGSVLGHAFYTLEREGVEVIAADEPIRSRTRRRQVFNKLVRDDIPAQIIEHGEKMALATIAKGEARPALAAKLLEEMFELLAARSPDEVTLELADVLEVVRSMASATGVDWIEVVDTADTKRKKRGSFERGVVLVETSWPKRGEQPDVLAPENIKLSQLSRPVSRGVLHEVPFSSLLAEGGDRTVTLTNGSMLTLSMSGSGVKIEEGPSKATSPLQLPLRFEQP
jgi:predicted house-cleaning noncanonical NTP pyrophosphatase (MazG superfamily)